MPRGFESHSLRQEKGKSPRFYKGFGVDLIISKLSFKRRGRIVGRVRAIGNRVARKGSRVRIPASPPGLWGSSSDGRAHPSHG